MIDSVWLIKYSEDWGESWSIGFVDTEHMAKEICDTLNSEISTKNEKAKINEASRESAYIELFAEYGLDYSIDLFPTNSDEGWSEERCKEFYKKSNKIDNEFPVDFDSSRYYYTKLDRYKKEWIDEGYRSYCKIMTDVKYDLINECGSSRKLFEEGTVWDRIKNWFTHIGD